MLIDQPFGAFDLCSDMIEVEDIEEGEGEKGLVNLLK